MHQRLVGALLSLPRLSKRAISLAIDMAFCTLAVWIAYYLRLGTVVSLDGRPTLAVLASILLAVPIFVVSGMYRAVLRYADRDLFPATLRACAGYGAIYATIFSGYGIDGIPRTVGIIQPIILFVMLFLSRAGAAYVLGGAYRKLSRPAPTDRTMIYGAGMAGQQLAAAIKEAGTMRVVGFIDDDASIQGRTIAGSRVYDSASLTSLISRLDVHHVLLAVPSASRQRRNEIISKLRDAQVEVRTLPGVLDLAHGEVRIDDLRPLSIEDLLSRSTVPVELGRVSGAIAGRVVMITGAGGSIGSELTRQIAALGPARLLLVETSEYALYSIHREIEVAAGGRCEIVPLLASVVDRSRVARIFEVWKPHQVYHAAAFKHVPLVEHNILEGVRNNALGTLVLGELAKDFGVENFVLVSTDKAVRPTNTMGASKRLAELILQAMAAQGSRTCFSMVRFGNVLGSSGSVVPLFREQIRAGGPVTITHPAMTRYFMTIPEAAQLVLQAGAMARGGEVFVLDMGEPVRILDLARNMIELSGLTVRDEHGQGDIEIRAVGTRPGEKLYEELLIGNSPQMTAHPRIMMAQEKWIAWETLQPQLERMAEHTTAHDIAAIRGLLMELVEEFVPTDGLVDWTRTGPDVRQQEDAV